MALLVLMTACASGGEAGSRTDLRVLTQQDFETVQGSTALDAVNQLRPRWLEGRSARSLGAVGQGILVYQDDNRIGVGADALRIIPLQAVYRMEWIDSTRAGLLPGAGSMHVDGAIIVYTSNPDR